MTDAAKYINQSSNKINYSNTRISPNELQIPSTEILFEDTTYELHPAVQVGDELPYFFEMSGADFHFDLFGMVFYLVARYEEYNANNVDSHNRYPSKHSVAVQNNFIQIPLVDLWIKRFGQMLKNKFEDLPLQKRVYHYQPSMDVDMAWSFQNKGIARNMGGFLKDLLNLNLPQAANRTDVLVGKKKDPFDQFDFMKSLHVNKGQSLLHFFLVANRGAYDKNISVENKNFQSLITKIASQNPIGLHPSYQSNNEFDILKTELEQLEIITKTKIKKSRQHFLKLQMPQTYRQLIDLGIKEDYTMGYPDVLGFRASTCVPYRWFDLGKNEVTELMIYPFQIMDVTLKNYLKLNPEEAILKSKDIIDQCKYVNGTFMTIWHNSSFDENEGWKDWDKVYLQIVDYAS